MARGHGSRREKPGKAKRQGRSSGNGNGATLGFEQKLWAAADKLRNNMDPSEYKHVARADGARHFCGYPPLRCLERSPFFLPGLTFFCDNSGKLPNDCYI